MRILLPPGHLVLLLLSLLLVVVVVVMVGLGAVVVDSLGGGRGRGRWVRAGGWGRRGGLGGRWVWVRGRGMRGPGIAHCGKSSISTLKVSFASIDIIRLHFTCGERKIREIIKNSQNIMTIVVVAGTKKSIQKSIATFLCDFLYSKY